MEEGDLGGVHSGGSWGDENVDWGKCADSRLRLDFISFDDGFEFEDGRVGEDEPNFAGKKVPECIEFFDGTSEFAEFIVEGV